MPRFVILEHDYPERHWDFMVESGEVLWTWRLPEPPAVGREPMAAVRIADHRLAYLEYEGPISGGRGSVHRWDEGFFFWDGEPTSGDSRLVAILEGTHYQGRMILEKTALANWLVHCERKSSED